jgi:hypothetical protein
MPENVMSNAPPFAHSTILLSVEQMDKHIQIFVHWNLKLVGKEVV